MRAELGRLLTTPPDVLLLDEPTNHLDLESVLWLQDHLAGSDITLVVISHDRAFLEALTQSIVEIDRGIVTRYAGGFRSYLRQRDERRAQLEASADAQARRIRETEKFIERFRAKATKARQVQSRIKALEKETRIVVEKDARKVSFQFPQPPRTGRLALALQNVSKSYEETHVYKDLDFRLETRRKDRTRRPQRRREVHPAETSGRSFKARPWRPGSRLASHSGLLRPTSPGNVGARQYGAAERDGLLP